MSRLAAYLLCWANVILALNNLWDATHTNSLWLGVAYFLLFVLGVVAAGMLWNSLKKKEG